MRLVSPLPSGYGFASADYVPRWFFIDRRYLIVHSAAGFTGETTMPIIDTGEERFRIEVGQVYKGWTLLAIENAPPGAQVGAFWFTFQQKEKEVRLSNRFWPADPMICLLNWLPHECPKSISQLSQNSPD